MHTGFRFLGREYSMDNYNYQSPVIMHDRSEQRFTEANIKLEDIQSQLAEMEIKLQALYSVIIEQGIDPKRVEDKIDELMKNRTAPTAPQLKARFCPECGKKVKPSSVDPLMGNCLFCGAKVPFNPSF